MKKIIALAGLLLSSNLLASPSRYARWLPREPGVTNSHVTQENINTTICVPGWTATVRPSSYYTNNIKKVQMKKLNLRGEMRDYAEDHKLPLGVGGSPRDARNLWPQPLRGRYNARVKDRLEKYVQRGICSGKFTLAEGQAMLIHDWITPYILIFGEPKLVSGRLVSSEDDN